MNFLFIIMYSKVEKYLEVILQRKKGNLGIFP